MKIEKILVTPIMAKVFLSNNSKNRIPKENRVTEYARQMLNGLWREDTGELLKFSDDGKLLDGQHRLRAVILANMAIYFHVATGLQESIFDVLDTGSVRNAADCFNIEKIKGANTIPAIIQTYIAITNNTIKQNRNGYKLTNSELLEEYHKNTIFWDDVYTKSNKWYNRFAKIIQPSIYGGMFAVLHKIDSKKAELFMDQLSDGKDITNNVIAILRQKLIADKTSLRKYPMSFKVAFIIKAWNCFYSNKELKILKYDPIIEQFPTILGL